MEYFCNSATGDSWQKRLLDNRQAVKKQVSNASISEDKFRDSACKVRLCIYTTQIEPDRKLLQPLF